MADHAKWHLLRSILGRDRVKQLPYIWPVFAEPHEQARALHMAAKRGCPECIAWLLARQPDPVGALWSAQDGQTVWDLLLAGYGNFNGRIIAVRALLVRAEIRQALADARGQLSVRV